ncbi:MAG: type I glyceraldehyde-3-phosphate dehydrogenase [Proteobacteria bacterium]|nr:type I glyceraldehyde-3-phosphate dehydrogenase [Pseudomonadota bacterium]MBU1741623.1 type I glyceraldehyde-3-phosphate dehydrogenase [Pseudomonadota bacterium]
MAVKVAINGFGRIGRLLTRYLAPGHPDLELVAVNSRADSHTLAHLLKYDSVHGRYDQKVTYDDQSLTIAGARILISRIADPPDLPWQDLGVDIVLETTGKFTKAEAASGHLKAGAKKVIIGAPGKGAIDGTFVYNVNHADYDPQKHNLISSASCTTNCLAPVAKVLQDNFGIESGLMTTIHSYTMSQRILDGSHKDLRRGRAAAMSMIPTTTGAARAVTLVIPALTGRLDGMAIRVPTPNVSLVDLTTTMARDVTVEAVNAAVKAAAEGPMMDTLAYVDEPLVSIDFVSSTAASYFDSLTTMVSGDRLLKVLAWYDNESGFSHQMVRLAAYVARLM